MKGLIVWRNHHADNELLGEIVDPAAAYPDRAHGHTVDRALSARFGCGARLLERCSPGVITLLVADVILGVAVLVLLKYRQLRIRPVNASALLLIAILVIIGLFQAYRFLSRTHAHPLMFAALGGSLVLAAIFGALRASTVRIWLEDRPGPRATG